MKWDYKIIAMIVYKNIFTKIFATLIAAVFVVPAFAASDNGCGDDENNRIVPVLALCSSHTYNIGLPYNPTTDSDKQLMRDVVAMKSTIMMQQMYKQYQFLESTLSRLKTQLEREILTSQLQAAGAASGDSSSSASASAQDMNIYLAGTSNCNNAATTAEVFTCLRNNYNLIYNMSNGGTNLTIELRRQLENDYNVMKMNMPTGVTIPAVSGGANSDLDCTDYQNITGRDAFQKCMNALNAGIRNATTELSKQTTNIYNPYGMR